MENEINWNAIITSNGVAEQIPLALEKLNSPLEKEREWAYWKIDNSAVLQSDLYEAAYYVIEPLVRLLISQKCIDHHRVIQLLIEIAQGYAPQNIKIFDESGKEISLMNACKTKLESFKNDINSLKLDNSENEREKLSLLEAIEH